MIDAYRIITSEGETLADSIPSLEQAQEVLYFKQLDYPDVHLEIESYRKHTVRGLGRDPDLH